MATPSLDAQITLTPSPAPAMRKRGNQKRARSPNDSLRSAAECERYFASVSEHGSAHSNACSAHRATRTRAVAHAIDYNEGGFLAIQQSLQPTIVYLTPLWNSSDSSDE